MYVLRSIQSSDFFQRWYEFVILVQLLQFSVASDVFLANVDVRHGALVADVFQGVLKVSAVVCYGWVGCVLAR